MAAGLRADLPTLEEFLAGAGLRGFVPEFQRLRLTVATLARASAEDRLEIESALGFELGDKLAFRHALEALSSSLPTSLSPAAPTPSSTPPTPASRPTLPLTATESAEKAALEACNASHFTLVRVLGAGQNGMVLQVRCTHPDIPDSTKYYALKAVFNLGLSTSHMSAFENEYAVLSTLPPHPNITRFYCEFKDRVPEWLVGHLPEFAQEVARSRQREGKELPMLQFLVTEYVPRTLEAVVLDMEEGVSVAQVMGWLEGLLKAVSFLESHGVAHTDLKPDNVLVRVDGSVVVCDFGTAKRLSLPDMMFRYLRDRSLGGNMSHWAPELHSAAKRGLTARDDWGGEDVSYARVDAFAVGVLGFEIALRMVGVGASHPIRDYPIPYIARDGSISLPPSALPTLPPSFPPALNTLLRSLLHPSPSSRPSTSSALSTLCSISSPPSSSPSSTTVTVQRATTGQRATIEVPAGVEGVVGVVVLLALVRSEFGVGDGVGGLVFCGRELRDVGEVGRESVVHFVEGGGGGGGEGGGAEVSSASPPLPTAPAAPRGPRPEKGELARAAREGRVEEVRELLERGADMGERVDGAQCGEIEWTPLHWAVTMGHAGVVRVLLDRGVDIGAKNTNGETFVHKAAGMGHAAVVRLLLDRGADIEAKNNVGSTPIHSAALNGHVEVVRLLLDRGADVEAENNRGWTPTYWAAYHGHAEVVGVLLDRGADIEAKGDDGEVPLHRAAVSGHAAVVGLLIDRGADIEAKDNSGNTPLAAAIAFNNSSTAALLRSRGARS